MSKRRACNICGRILNQPDDPSTLDCGGDCQRCMAAAGDPDCIAAERTGPTPVATSVYQAYLATLLDRMEGKVNE